MEFNNKTERSEIQWVELSEAAMAHWAMGQFEAAAEKWEQALGIAKQFDLNDPRRASSLSNVGIAHRSRGEFSQAEQVYQQALTGWKAASNWLNKIQVGARARSSLFHLRMERKHHKQFTTNVIRGHEKLLPAGRAGTHNNLAELYQITNRLAESERLYREALEERVNSIDDQELGVAIIQKNIEGLVHIDERSVTQPNPKQTHHDVFSAQATRKRWVIDQPPQFTGEGRLMAALLLTHVIDHSKL